MTASSEDWAGSCLRVRRSIYRVRRCGTAESSARALEVRLRSVEYIKRHPDVLRFRSPAHHRARASAQWHDIAPATPRGVPGPGSARVLGADVSRSHQRGGSRGRQAATHQRTGPDAARSEAVRPSSIGSTTPLRPAPTRTGSCWSPASRHRRSDQPSGSRTTGAGCWTTRTWSGPTASSSSGCRSSCISAQGSGWC